MNRLCRLWAPWYDVYWVFVWSGSSQHYFSPMIWILISLILIDIHFAFMIPILPDSFESQVFITSCMFHLKYYHLFLLLPQWLQTAVEKDISK